MTSVFPLFVTVFVAAFFFGAAGFFFTDTIFFTGAAFFAAGRDTAVGFFLVTVTVFFLAAAARGAFFAALFFAFGTAFAMNLHHIRSFPAGDREETALLEHSECPHLYVMDTASRQR
jgi:hypothetical protein